MVNTYVLPFLSDSGYLIAFNTSTGSPNADKLVTLSREENSWKILDSIEFMNHPYIMDVDGNTIMAGIPGDSSLGVSKAGAVYFFEVE